MTLSIVFIGAHPDDETMLAGGTLGMLSQSGHDVHIMCATRGEGGELGEPPVTDDREQLGPIREKELRCACQALGTANVALLPYQDPIIGPGEELYPFEADFDVLVNQIRQILLEWQADVVISHGSDGEYGHPAHQLLHRASLQAAQFTDTIMYSVAAFVPDIEDRLWNKSDFAHLVLDIEPWLEIKHQAALCHMSQHALFKRRRKLTNVRDALRRVESFHQHWRPPTISDPFAETLLAAGAWRPEQKVWPEP